VSEARGAELSRFEPPVSEISKVFWDATRRKELIVQWCVDCDAPFFYPRAVCPVCIGENIEWRRCSGRGTVYAVTVEHHPQNPMMASRAPYAVALVELEEGIRMLTNIVGCTPKNVAVDMHVTVTWEPLSDGRHLMVFEPL
jgi:uncharacterized protein